jgi:hypothetical protein
VHPKNGLLLRMILQEAEFEHMSALLTAISIICANESEPWLRQVLSSELKALPLPLLDHLSPHGHGQSAAAMPYYERDGKSICPVKLRR